MNFGPILPRAGILTNGVVLCYSMSGGILAVCLRVITRGGADVDIKVLTEGPPNLRSELGTFVADYVIR